MSKSPEAFRTISEVAQWLAVPTHVLRFWESRFTQIKPVKRAGGRRYYRPADMALLAGIKQLLHDDGMTIRGVQKILREKGVRHVAQLAPVAPEDMAALDMVDEALVEVENDHAPASPPPVAPSATPFVADPEDDDAPAAPSVLTRLLRLSPDDVACHGTLAADALRRLAKLRARMADLSAAAE